MGRRWARCRPPMHTGAGLPACMAPSHDEQLLYIWGHYVIEDRVHLLRCTFGPCVSNVLRIKFCALGSEYR